MANTAMTVRIPEAQLEKLKKIASERGITVNGLLNTILWDYVMDSNGPRRKEVI